MTEPAAAPPETSAPAIAPAPPTQPPPSPPAARLGRRLLWGAVGLVLLALVVAGGISTWVWRTEAGALWALQRVPGLAIEGWQGAPGQGTMGAARLRLPTAAGELALEDVRITGLNLVWRPAPGMWWRIEAESVRMRQLRWQSAPSDAPSSGLPGSLRAPIAVRVPDLAIDTLLIDEQAPITQLRADLDLGDDAGAVHRVRALVAQTPQVALGGDVSVATDAPFKTHAELGLRSQERGDGALPFSASAELNGPLAQLALKASLDGRGMLVHARGDVKPFAPWPLGDFELTARALDLAALAEGAPRTRLDVDATVHTAGLTRPAEVRATATNADAGRWDQGRLPVSALKLTVSGTPEPLRALQIETLDIGLVAGGRISGQGEVKLDGDHHAVQLDLRATNVQPAQLDVRAPAMRLSGPLALTARDLNAYPRGDWALGLRTALQGTLAAAQSTPVALNLDANASTKGLQLTSAEATAGPARAAVQGRLNGPPLSGGAAWQWALQGQLRDFNPALWWPGEPGSTWRSEPHRLNLTLRSDASVPASASRAPLDAWRAIRGSLDAQIDPSVLAGVPLSGEARAALAGEATTLDAALHAGGNDLTLTRAATDPALLRVNAPKLAALAPLLQWVPQAAAWAPASGRLTAEATLHHLLDAAPIRWQTSGKIADVQTPSASLGRAQWQGSGETRLDAPLALSLSLHDFTQGPPVRPADAGPPPKLDALRLEVSGTLAAHHLALDATSPLRPPEWLADWLAVDEGRGSQLRLRLAGNWTSNAAKGQPWWQAGRWQGRIEELLAMAQSGTQGTWLAGKDLALQATWNASGLQAFSAEPGELTLPITALRWRDARWTPTRWAVDADLDAFELAPLLARAQPELGWRGDLVLGGHVRMAHEARFDADIVFERQSGDLRLADDPRAPQSSGRALGLSALRLALSAHDGRWQLTPSLAGEQLGELAGVLAVQTTPDRPWPHDAAPLSGTLQARIEKLNAWATWLPPGWRLDGQLAAIAQFAGRFGAPEVRGGLTGESVAVRNVLEGVELREGQIDIALDGNTAHINKMTFKGGDGTLAVTGEATLGANPKAQLQATAERFQALGRIDRRLIVTGKAEAKLDAQQMAVDGDLRVDEGLIDVSQGGAPKLADDITVVRSSGVGAGGGSSGAPRGTASGTTTAAGVADGASQRDAALAAEAVAAQPSAAARMMALHIKANLGEKLRLKGRGIDTGLRGELLLTSPDGKPQLHGTVRTDGGLYAAYGQRLTISRGEITFTGPIDTPRLDILAVRPNLDILVGVAVTGRAVQPQVRLVSEPEMSDMDKLSWLMLGRAPEGLGQADTALLQRAAMALLSGEGEGMTDAMLRSLGITDFGISQTDEGSVRDTVVTLGRQISQRWYIGYVHSVNKASGTWQLIYRIARRFTLRASAGAEDSSVEAIWMWRWD